MSNDSNHDSGFEIKSKEVELKGVLRMLHPVARFLHMETAGGIVLIICAAVAMIWANSPWHDSYHHLFHMPFRIQIGTFLLDFSVHHWINDVLMTIFFFVVGLEIKREIVTGELSTMKKASLPLFAALGGMVVPALIYFYFNPTGPAVSGWGIPMATDIAFAVGVLSLLGNRVPFTLKIFVLALAIVDDLGAVLVIAVFYTKSLSVIHLGYAAAIGAVIYLFNRMNVRQVGIYVILGGFLWLFVFLSGVHATIAGVVLGFLTPAHSLIPRVNLLTHLRNFIDHAKDAVIPNLDKTKHLSNNHPIDHDTQKILAEVKFLADEATPPLDRIMHGLHFMVTYLIMPLFALANAGVDLSGVQMDTVFGSSIFQGVSLGLLVGKPLGILLFSIVAIKLGLAVMPKGISWQSFAGASCLAGIGFTMALFISGLAITSAEMTVFSKMGILIGSAIAAVLGFILIKTAKPASD